MKDAFRAYQPPTANELDGLWAEGMIVLDTNALLNVLRYSKSTRDQLLEVLEARAEQLWLPHQVGVEFYRNLASIPAEQDALFGVARSQLATGLEVVTEGVERSLTRLNPAEARAIRKNLKKQFRKAIDRLAAVAEEHRHSVLDEAEQSAAVTRIEELFDGRVGKSFDQKRLAGVYKEADLRYAIRFPPGYMDMKKDSPAKYGDFVIWAQIRVRGAETKLPLIFVTGDMKEDWWAGATGPNPTARAELVEEYFVESGRRAVFYTVPDFLEEAKRRGAIVSDETLAEADTAVRESKNLLWTKNWSSAFDQQAAVFKAADFQSALDRIAARAVVPEADYAALAKAAQAMASAMPPVEIDSAALSQLVRNIQNVMNHSLPVSIPDGLAEAMRTLAAAAEIARADVGSDRKDAQELENDIASDGEDEPEEDNEEDG